MGSEKNLGLKNFWSEKKFGQDFCLGPIKLLVQKCLGPENFGSEEVWSTKILNPIKLDQKSLATIGQVTSEILLI